MNNIVSLSDVDIIVAPSNTDALCVPKQQTELQLLDKLIKGTIITGCAATCAYACYFYLPVIAFQAGYHGSLLVSSYLAPQASTITYYIIILPKAVHIGTYCYSSPLVASAVQTISTVTGAAIGISIVELYELIKKVVQKPIIIKQTIERICNAVKRFINRMYWASSTGTTVIT
jgi:hypothetical protein